MLNLWQKNNVFAPDVIQPLFDLANPDHPVHQQYYQQQGGQADLSNGLKRDSPAQKDGGVPETVSFYCIFDWNDYLCVAYRNNVRLILFSHNLQKNIQLSTANVQKFQYQQMLLQQQQSASLDNSGLDALKFGGLDYDYGSDNNNDKGEQLPGIGPTSSFLQFPFNNFTKCLEDPNVLKQLQNIKQMDVQRYLNDIPSASGAMIDPQQQQGSITIANINSLRGPPPPLDNKDQDVEFIGDLTVPEVIPISSRSPTPTRHKRRKSRTRSRSRDRGRYRRRRSRSRSRSRSYRSRSRSRSPRNKRRSSRDRAREKEREAEKERRRKGLPDIKKDQMSVCSTTLWVGHLSKLVQQEELSDTFGKYGDIVSIDMIPPRGCAYIVMNRRQDAYKAMQSLKNHKMQNRAITISWAAGKGVKSKEWKDYFDQTLGCTYIPYTKLDDTTDFIALEEGGMYDDETMPIWVKEKLKQPPAQPLINKEQSLFPQFFSQTIDTSQPPPNASLMPTIPPFSLGARPLLVPTPGMLGLGVPPPNMLMPGMIFPSDLNKLQPGLMGFPMPSNAQQVLATAGSHQTLQQQPSDDQMDIEMDEESSSSKNEGSGSLMSQGYFNQPPPANMQNMLMGNNQMMNDQQDEANNFNNSRMGSRNNRSQSRERDNRDYRRGPRDRNDRRSNDFNGGRNQRWGNDSNGGARSRSREGESDTSMFLWDFDTNCSNQTDSQYNRRSNQQDIPSLMSQQIPLMDNDVMNSRQRNNGWFDKSMNFVK